MSIKRQAKLIGFPAGVFAFSFIWYFAESGGREEELWVRFEYASSLALLTTVLALALAAWIRFVRRRQTEHEQMQRIIDQDSEWLHKRLDELHLWSKR